jgi:hypothetical protein
MDAGEIIFIIILIIFAGPIIAIGISILGFFGIIAKGVKDSITNKKEE